MGLETRSGLYQHNQGGIKLVRRLLRCRRFQFVRKHREINTGASKGRGSGCSLTGPGEPGRAGPVPCLRAGGDDDRRGGHDGTVCLRGSGLYHAVCTWGNHAHDERGEGGDSPRSQWDAGGARTCAGPASRSCACALPLAEGG